MASGNESQTQYETVDDVFQSLSIPEIKSLEIELRSQAASKKTELRLLVGESYRGLLTTADTIVAMRDSSIAVRRQLNTLVAACDGQAVSKKLRNLRSFPTFEAKVKTKALIAYMAELRALVIHFIRNSDLMTAARLYSLGRLVSSTVSREGLDLSMRLKRVRGILIKAINQCMDVREFACSFVILESATPQTCLKYFLSLRLTDFRGCKSLPDLANDILRVIDTSREFAHLSDAFEQLTKKTLISSIASLPELDGESLRQCLPENLLHFKPFLRAEPLTPPAIKQHVEQWIASSGLLMREIVTNILSQTRDIAIVFKQSKDVRNLLNEASQEAIYDTILPSVDDHISLVLNETIDVLSKTKPLLKKPNKHQETVANLWSSKIPWTKGTLNNFRFVTRTVSKGMSSSFTNFERSYVPATQTIKNNLDILSRSKGNTKRRESYRASVLSSMKSLQDTLLEEAQAASEPSSIIQILRLLLFISNTSPVPLQKAPESTSQFRRLIPQIQYSCTFNDYSAIFENKLPVGISPELATYLFTFTARISEIGIDIIGRAERAELREVIHSELQSSITRYIHKRGNNDLTSASGQSAEMRDLPDRPLPAEAAAVNQASDKTISAPGDIDNDSSRNQSSPQDPDNPAEATNGSKPESSATNAPIETAADSKLEAEESSLHSPESEKISEMTHGTGHAVNGELSASAIRHPGEAMTENAESSRENSLRQSHSPIPALQSASHLMDRSDAHAIDLQNHFDMTFVQRLLSLPQFTAILNITQLTDEQTEKMAENLKSAVERAKIQFRILLL